MRRKSDLVGTGEIKEIVNTTLEIGDKVRSIRHRAVGFSHQINENNKAWVSDSPDGTSGQYYDLEELVKA